MLRCAFCGLVPTQLPHLCLLEKSKAEEEALSAWAAREAEWESERQVYRQQIRALSRRIVADEQRFSALEGRIAPLEAKAS